MRNHSNHLPAESRLETDVAYARVKLDQPYPQPTGDPITFEKGGLHTIEDVGPNPRPLTTIGYRLGSYDAACTYGSMVYAFNGGFGAPPNTPSNVTASAINAHEIELNWSYTGPTPDGFFIEYRTNSQPNWTRISTTLPATARSYVHTGLVPKTRYWYRILAYNDTNSNYSAVATDETWDVPPAAPDMTFMSNLTHESTPNSILVIWRDNADNEQWFEVDRSVETPTETSWVRIGQAPFSPSVGNNQSMVDSGQFLEGGLLPYTHYWYRVRAKNVVYTGVNGPIYGYSDWSEPHQYRTKRAIPNAPTNLVANPQPLIPGGDVFSVDLSWVDNSSDQGSEERFAV